MLINLEHYQDFDRKISEFVAQTGADYIDAVLQYCEKHGLEIESIGELIQNSPNLKLKIELEAEDLHWLRKTDRLPQ